LSIQTEDALIPLNPVDLSINAQLFPTSPDLGQPRQGPANPGDTAFATTVVAQAERWLHAGPPRQDFYRDGVGSGAVRRDRELAAEKPCGFVRGTQLGINDAR